MKRRKKILEKLEPIATLTVEEPGPAGGLLESFYSGEDFWKEVWKHRKKWSDEESYRLTITFGHKFFHWCNVNNRRVWVKSTCGRVLSDWNSWKLLRGEVIFPGQKGAKSLLIRVFFAD